MIKYLKMYNHRDVVDKKNVNKIMHSYSFVKVIH